jgi:hypothetical protein
MIEVAFDPTIKSLMGAYTVVVALFGVIGFGWFAEIMFMRRHKNKILLPLSLVCVCLSLWCCVTTVFGLSPIFGLQNGVIQTNAYYARPNVILMLLMVTGWVAWRAYKGRV